MITTRPAFPAALSVFVLNQFAGRLRHQLRAFARAALEEQQALAEDEAVEQEGPCVGFLGLEAAGAIELPDIFQSRGVDAGDGVCGFFVAARPLPDRKLNR